MTMKTINDDQIAEAAFYIWIEEGQPEGRDLEHWLKAKSTLEGAQTKAKRAPAKPRARVAASAARKSPAPKAKTPRKASTKPAARKPAPTVAG